MSETRRVIIDAAMRLTATRGWSQVSLADIAAAAGISLVQLHQTVPAKHALLCQLSDLATETALATIKPDTFTTETPRERLLEILMARFDALAPFKPGLKAIAADLPRDPAGMTLIAALMPHAMGWMLEAAGISPHTLSGPLKVLGLTALYSRALRVWLDDDSADSDRTMAELDRLLRHAESFMRLCGQ